MRPRTNTLWHCLRVAGFVAAYCVVVINGSAATAEQAIFKEWKSRLPFISLWDYLNDREPRDYTGDGKLKGPWLTLQEIAATALDFDQLANAAENSDPAVRSIALLCLWAKQTKKAIPIFHNHLNDQGITAPEESGQLGSISIGITPANTKPLTVGRIAMQMLRIAGAKIDSVGSSKTLDVVGGFDSWWFSRKDNPDWLGWYELLYKRASQGTLPVPVSRSSQMNEFRRTIDSTSPVTRAWALLYLADDIFSFDGYWHPFYATEPEMIEAAKLLGPARLIEFLKTGQRSGLRHPYIDDPKRGSLFILSHAKQLFRPEDAAALRTLGHVVAASDANPAHASKWLRAALKASDSRHGAGNRGEMMAALADLGDTDDWRYAVNWFYAESDDEGRSSGQNQFIHEFEYRRPAHWSRVMHLIVAHPGFDRVSPLNVVYAVLLVQKLGGREIASQDLLQDEKSDLLREVLRKHFNVKPQPIRELETPANLLTAPEWSVELKPPCVSLAISPDSSKVAISSESEDQGIVLFDMADGKMIGHLKDQRPSLEISFCQPGQRLLSFSRNGETWIREWNLSDLTESSSIGWPSSLNERPDHVTVDRPGFYAVGQAFEGPVILDLRALQKKWSARWGVRASDPAVIAPDGSTAIVGRYTSNELLLLHVDRESVIARLQGHAAQPTKVAYSNDSKLIASTGEDNRLIVWKANSGQRIATFMSCMVRFSPAAFTADSKCIVVSPKSNIVAVYDVATGRPVCGIKAVGNWVSHLAATPDGRHLLVVTQVSLGYGGAPGNYSRLDCWYLPPSEITTPVKKPVSSHRAPVSRG